MLARELAQRHRGTPLFGIGERFWRNHPWVTFAIARTGDLALSPETTPFSGLGVSLAEKARGRRKEDEEGVSRPRQTGEAYCLESEVCHRE